MLYSRSCEYAIQAMLYLSLQPDGRLVLIKDISDGLRIPNPFLAKIVQSLVRADLLKSYKGRRGGICLARSAEDIRLIEIVAAIDSLGVFKHCILGFPACSDTHWCPMHDSWKALRGALQTYFETKNLAELAIECRRKMENIPEYSRLLPEAVVPAS